MQFTLSAPQSLYCGRHGINAGLPVIIRVKASGVQCWDHGNAESKSHAVLWDRIDKEAVVADFLRYRAVFWARRKFLSSTEIPCLIQEPGKSSQGGKTIRFPMARFVSLGNAGLPWGPGSKARRAHVRRDQTIFRSGDQWTVTKGHAHTSLLDFAVISHRCWPQWLSTALPMTTADMILPLVFPVTSLDGQGRSERSMSGDKGTGLLLPPLPLNCGGDLIMKRARYLRKAKKTFSICLSSFHVHLEATNLLDWHCHMGQIMS